MSNNANGSLALPPEMLVNIDRYAVYRCYSDGGELLYIGVTGNTGRRLGDHLQKAWFVQVRGMTFEWYADELDARNAERRAIHVEHPKYNVVHRNVPTLAAPARRGANMPRGAGRYRSPEVHFAAELAAGTVPSARRIQREMGVGFIRASEMRQSLADVVAIGTRSGSSSPVHAAAQKRYAAAIASGNLPSLRQIRIDMKVGQERAREIRASLEAKAAETA